MEYATLCMSMRWATYAIRHECALGRSIQAAQIARFGRKQAIRSAARLVDHSGGYSRFNGDQAYSLRVIGIQADVQRDR